MLLPSGDIRSWLAQWTEYPIGVGSGGQPRSLNPDDFYFQSVQLLNTVTSANKAAVPQATMSAPSNFHMLIMGIEGHVALNDATAETLSIVGIGNPTAKERVILKAMNARVALKNTSRASGQKLFETADKALVNITPAADGVTLWLPIPILVPNAEDLALDTTMRDTTASVIGGSTDIGLDLICYFVRSKP